MPRAKAAKNPVKVSASALSYTVSGLAKAWELSQSQVSQWKQAGMPFGADGRIALAAATHWLRGHERRERKRVDGSDAISRRAEADAELMELRLARELGDVVLASEVYAKAEQEATRVRAIVAQLASTYAPLVATRLACGLRDASAALREVADQLAAQLAASDDDEQEAA
jgi:hypothetical protein